ncbi:hypothetical protein ACVNF4_16295 [Streptomyces sp. S6]
MVKLDRVGTGFYEHISVDDTVRAVALDGHGRVAIVEDDFYLQRRRGRHLPVAAAQARSHRERPAGSWRRIPACSSVPCTRWA